MGCLLKHPIFLAFPKGARADAPLLLVRHFRAYVVARVSRTVARLDGSHLQPSTPEADQALIPD